MATTVGADSSKTVRVLVVDDEQDQFVLVRGLLSSFTNPSYRVEWAESYSAGIVVVGQDTFDVCLVDYRLGQMDGVQFITEMNAQWPSLPFILVTGRGDRAVDMQAMGAGAVDYLSKGELDGPTLERTIRYAIKVQELMDVVRDDQRRTASLDDVSQAMSSAGPSPLGLQDVLDVLHERLGYGSSAIYRLSGDQLILGGARGFTKPLQFLPAHSGPIGHVLATGKPLIIPAWTETTSLPSTPSQYTIPIVFEARQVGLLTVAITSDRPMDDAERTALLEIGARVGNAIGMREERTWLADRLLMLRRANDFIEGMLGDETGFDLLGRTLTRLQEAFAADGLALAMTETDQGLLVDAATGSLADRVGRTIGQLPSVAGRVREQGTAQVDSSSTSCAAFAPVLIDHQVRGLLWVDRRGLDARYTALEVEALALLGIEVGVGIAVARERAAAAAASVRDPSTGVFNRPFFDALIDTLASTDAPTAGPIGLVMVAANDHDRVSLREEQRALDAMCKAATNQIAGGPDLVARLGRTCIAILVRERAGDRTSRVAQALAAEAARDDVIDLAVGWTVRPPEEMGTLVARAEMALELARRTRAVVEA